MLDVLVRPQGTRHFAISPFELGIGIKTLVFGAMHLRNHKLEEENVISGVGPSSAFDQRTDLGRIIESNVAAQ